MEEKERVVILNDNAVLSELDKIILNESEKKDHNDKKEENK